jgi:primosomal protein N' (replication factor Y)
LARAFPDVPVRTSGRASGVIDRIGSEPVIVVATVDAEPIADGGYQGAVLLDGSALLARTELRSEEQTVRRWFNVMALVRGADQGGKVAVTMDPTHRAVQALVRMDPIGWATRELDDRRETGLPPVTRSLTVTGEPHTVADFLTRANLDPGWRVLGPVPVPVVALSAPARTIPMDSVGPTGGQRVRVLVLVPIADGPRLATAAKAALCATPDRGSPAHLHIRIDSTTLL